MSEEKNTQDTQVDNTTDQQEVETQQSEQTEQVDPTEIEKKVKRELSKKLNVNLFDEKETDSFIESLQNKVDKSEIEKYEAEVEKYKGYETKYKETQFENAILKHNISEDYQDKVKKLVGVEMQDAEDMTYSEAVEKVVKDFPEFTKRTRKGGMDVNSNSNITAQEEYINKNYMKDASGKLVRKRRR